MLAWLQKELQLYSELILIAPIRIEDKHLEYLQGKPFLCLTHHYFPNSIPNLIEQLKEQDTTLACCQIFYDKLGVHIPSLQQQLNDKDWLNYLYQIQTGIESKRQEEVTLRELHIGKNIETDEKESHIIETMGDALLKSLNKLFHQTVELSLKEEENSSTSSSTSNNTRSPSPRIHTARSIEELSDALVDQKPIRSRRNTEDAIITTTTTTTITTSTTITTTTLTRQEIESALLSIESKELIDFYNTVNDLSFAVKAHPNIAIYISAIDATHAAIHLQLHKGEILQSTIQFTNTASSIRNELEFIQAKMLKTTTTDVGIQDLESRVTSTGHWIHNLHDRFKDTSLFLTDVDTQREYQALLDKYNSISHWVDEVRIWFVEAERIRGWIEERIKILEDKPSLNPLDEIELEYEFETIQQLNEDQKLLEEEVESFDGEDMTRLRAHVKALTGGNKDLSPADTTTIEITFTTLMTLDRLMHLLRRYSYELQITTLRIYWEQEYSIAVAWVRSTLEKLKVFVQQKARWRPPSSDEQQQQQGNRQEIIDTLIDFEKQSSAFDAGQFTTTVNRYQDLDDACNIELPGHLESRQVAIEEQFEELTNRIAFARQVVEQFLVVSDFLDRVDKLKGEGEALRSQMTLAAEQHTNNNNNKLNDFNEKVALFQENAVRLVTGVAARVPYPEATHPIDGQGNDVANEEIRLVISARKSSLVLFGEALDQSLNAYRRSLQLQKRGKQLRDEINRLLSWVDERMKSIKKSKVDVFVGKCALDDADLSRLKKERDGQASKLNGIKENEIKRLVENIEALKTSSAQPPTNPNTVTLVADLHGGMKDLETQLEVLHDALQVHTLCLDILEKRISWETQHAKSSLWISDMTFQMWEFVSRKAQWRPDDTVVPIDHAVLKADFEVLQHKVKAFHQDHLVLVDQTFTDLVDGFRIIIDRHVVDEDQPPQDNITPEHVQRRQDSLNQSYLNLCDLLDFTEGVLSQQSALTVFFSIVYTLKEKGLVLMSDIERANESIMDLDGVEEYRQRFLTSVQQYDSDIVDLWMQHGARLPYPQCPEDARATRPTTSDDDVSTEVATVVYETYTELQHLVKKITDTLQIFDISISYRSRLEQWCADANAFGKKVTELKEVVEREHTFDLQSGAVIKVDSTTEMMADCLKRSQDLATQVAQLQSEQYDPLVLRIQDLNEEIGLAQQHGEDPGRQENTCKTCVNTSITEKPKDALDNAWQALKDTVALFTNRTILCDQISEWEKLWDEQWVFFNGLGDRVREWNNEKNVYQSSHQVEETGVLSTLLSNLKDADASLQDRLENAFPPLKDLFAKMITSYGKVQLSSEERDNFTSCFKSKDEELDKSVSKLQDMISTLREETQLLKARDEWELAVDRELKLFAERTLETESFIRHTARWSNENAEIIVSKDAAQPMHEASVVQKQDLLRLLNTLSELQKSSPLFQTESIFKKKIALEHNIEKLEHSINFVDQVLAQRFAIVAHLDTIAQLENEAESIKTQFLSANDSIDAKEQQLIGDYKSHISQLQITIDLPVRQYDEGDRREDAAHNTAMTDMLNARKSRLHELCASLDSILKSKESLSRCKAAEATYMAEARVVQEWISQKSAALDAIKSSDETVEDLRAAVTAVGTIQSAVTNYTSSITSLKESATQCIALVQSDRDVGGDDTTSIANRIQSAQSSVDASWDQLCKTLEGKKNTWSTALRHAEYLQHIDSFHTQCMAFREKVENMDLSTVTEDISNDWQNEIQQLDSVWIEQIRTRFSEEKIKCEDNTRSDNVTRDTLKEMNTLLTTALGEFDGLKTLVKEKTTEASHFRFKKEYFQSADTLESHMSETREALTGLRKSTVKEEQQHMIRGVDLEADEKIAQHVAETYASICDLFDSHHEKYDELRSFYRFLQLNKVTQLDQVDARQTAIEQLWKDLKSDVLEEKQYVDGLSRWYDLHRKLNEMQSEALDGGIFSRLNGMVLSGEEEKLPAFLEEDASLLKLLSSRMSACWDIASHMEDDKNFEHFKTHYEHVETELERANRLLNEKKLEAERHVDFLGCQKQVQEVKQSVEKAVDVIQQRINTLSLDDNACTSKEIEQLFRNYATAVATTESQQKKLMSQLTTVIEPAIAALNEKYPDDDRHGSIQTDVDESVRSLSQAFEKEQAIQDFMRRVLGHAKSAQDIVAWIDNCESAIAQIAADNLDENDALLKIGSLRQKLEDFQHVIDSFQEISSNLVLDEKEDTVILKQLLEVANANTTTIESRRRKVHEELNDVESTIEKTARGIAIARKFKVIMGMVGEARDYVTGVKLCTVVDSPASEDKVTEPSSPAVDNADESDDDKTRIGGESDEPKILVVEQHQQLQQSLLSMLREPEVKDIQRNLLALESDIKPQIEQELQQLSAMIENCKDIDVTFTRQHEEVKESVASFFDILSEKYTKVEKALVIGKYLTIADDIDILQSSLEEAVSKSASSTTTTLMGKNNTASTPQGLSRTDLQAKLIELDARFKYYERKIVQHLSEAKDVASLITDEDDSKLVDAHLKEMEQKWLLIKKQFKTRKIELSRTIDSSLDYKDGQQARIRKSSLPTRKASSLLRERGIAADLSLTTTTSRRLSPTASTSGSRSRLGSNNASSTTTSRYLTPPLQHQPSKSATYLKSTTKSGRLPIINKPPLNSYVADPHNDLDIEIGRIVNETPYRVKVKMVPGEVGRYWFGDLNPKLAYCRVLKSKMVMVRVGGGWTELSQFLRDHALLEGDFIPRSRRNTNNLKSVIPEEDEPKSPTIQEGFIETRRDLSYQPQQQKSSTTTSSSNSSRSTHHLTGSPSHSSNTSGYKDGDKFITLDLHGNQHEVKMRKVPDMGRSSSTTTSSNDFTRRRIARRKEKLTNNNSSSTATTTTTTT